MWFLDVGVVEDFSGLVQCDLSTMVDKNGDVLDF